MYVGTRQALFRCVGDEERERRQTHVSRPVVRFSCKGLESIRSALCILNTKKREIDGKMSEVGCILFSAVHS